jgi:hypothetical protein
MDRGGLRIMPYISKGYNDGWRPGEGLSRSGGKEE